MKHTVDSCEATATPITCLIQDRASWRQRQVVITASTRDIVAAGNKDRTT